MVEMLMVRAVEHDASKFCRDEFDTFAMVTPKLRGMTYGSEEYNASLAEMKTCLDHHYSNNTHHPEHHRGGFWDMTLLDWIEMLADWKAATQRHADGDLYRSIDQNAKRFGYDENMIAVLKKTARSMGW